MNLKRPIAMLALVAVASLVATVPKSAGGNAVSLGSGECFRRSLNSPLTWVAGTAWSTNEMLVVDPQRRDIFRFDRHGQFQGSLGRFPNSVLPNSEFHPVGVVPFGPKLFIKLAGAHSLLVDRSRELVSYRNLSTEQTTSASVGSVYDSTYFRGWLYGYGSIYGVARDLQDPTPFTLGFFAAPLADLPKNARLLEPFKQNAYYLLGHEYVTSNRLGAFSLAMDETPAIQHWRPETGLRELESMPAAFRRIPLPKTESTGPASSRPLFAEIETLEIPVGIYSVGDELLLLGRRPLESGKSTRWTVHRIDPVSDRIVGPALTLPTTKNHLNVVVSDAGFTYILEKGSVEGWGQQSIDSILAIPTSWFEGGSSSPLARTAVGPGLCRDVTSFPLLNSGR